MHPMEVYYKQDVPGRVKDTQRKAMNKTHEVMAHINVCMLLLMQYMVIRQQQQGIDNVITSGLNVKNFL